MRPYRPDPDALRGGYAYTHAHLDANGNAYTHGHSYPHADAYPHAGLSAGTVPDRIALTYPVGTAYANRIADALDATADEHRDPAYSGPLRRRTDVGAVDLHRLRRAPVDDAADLEVIRRRLADIRAMPDSFGNDWTSSEDHPV